MFPQPNVSDVNECVSNNGGCDHICVNTVGSHTCKCKDGWTLETDKMNCKGNIVYFRDTASLYYLD